MQTTALGNGLSVKAGRFLSGVGYLNAQHAHTWDFVDAPLAYQALLGTQLGGDAQHGHTPHEVADRQHAAAPPAVDEHAGERADDRVHHEIAGGCSKRLQQRLAQARNLTATEREHDALDGLSWRAPGSGRKFGPQGRIRGAEQKAGVAVRRATRHLGGRRRRIDHEVTG